MKKTLIIIFLLLIPSVFAYTQGSLRGSESDPSLCDERVWSCSKWTECSADQKQTRSCILNRDCPGAFTFKPIEETACQYQSKIVSKLECHDLSSSTERIDCRLKLTDAINKKQLRQAYLPEDCRAHKNPVDRDACIQLYLDTESCWVKSISERHACAAAKLNLTNSTAAKESCKDADCTKNIQRKAYGLIKFSIYELEVRAETMLEQGVITQAQAIGIIDSLETKKMQFDSATTKEAKRNALLETKQLWNDFIRGLS